VVNSTAIISSDREIRVFMGLTPCLGQGAGTLPDIGFNKGIRELGGDFYYIIVIYTFPKTYVADLRQVNA
jgi:hypothetical protein